MAADLRSFGRRFTLWLDALCGIAAAIVVVVLYLRPETFGTPQGDGAVILRTRENAVLEAVVIVGVLLLVINALLVVYGRGSREPLQFVRSQAPGGDVRVAREALEAALRTAGEELSVIHRVRVTILRTMPKRLAVRAMFHAPEGVSVRDASHQLRMALAQRFAEMVELPEGTRTDYAIEFAGFAGKLAKGSELPPVEVAPAEEPAPFTGPRYPISEEPRGEGE